MTPQELKASILQLAIQGKLVEQRPEEGTGAELREKILAAKDAGKNLTRRRGGGAALPLGKNSAHSAPPRGEILDAPFDIPESWVWVRLGEVGSWASGATPSRTQAEFFGGNIPWLKTGDLTDGYVSSIPETITELALEKTSVRLNPAGSVLMAMYGATIGKLGILQIAATTNQACCACIPYDGMLNKFLFYFLLASRKAFIKMGEGGAQPNISKEKIDTALLTLPPLAEQTRIVAKIPESYRMPTVTGVAGRRGFCNILVEKSMMNGQIGFGAEFLKIFEENRVSFEHCPTGIDTMSVVVNHEHFDAKRDKILSEIQERLQPDTLTVEDNLALVAVVGHGMVSSRGCAARIFRAVADAGINIRMIDQGSCELNIILAVDNQDFEEAIRAIYREFR